MTAPGSDTPNVVVAAFDDRRTALSTLARLEALDARHQVELKAAIVVVRQWDGRVIEQCSRTAVAGAVQAYDFLRLLTGIIGGPLGVLIGGPSGALVGSVFDGSHVPEVASVLADISAGVSVGRTALLAAVIEPDLRVVDANLSEFGEPLLRWTLHDVEVELSAARRAERAARSAARADLFDSQREHAQGRQRTSR